MGMGYGANYADIISAEDVEKICPDEWKAFIAALETEEETVDSFAMEAMCDERPEKKTQLEIGIGYHNSDDEGSRYDDVDGAYWWVSGMYELTEAGKKMEDIVRRHFWVTFG